jgi:hypothetical protein
MHRRNLTDTVASEKDDQMSETMIKNRNLPNPHLFEPFFCTRACHHPLPYYYLIFEAIGKPAWSIKQKLIIQALINLSNDDFYIEVKTGVP